jgi:hypothetical protein
MLDRQKPKESRSCAKFYLHNLIKGMRDLPDLEYCPFFADFAGESLVQTFEGVVTAYFKLKLKLKLNLDTRMRFNPNLASITSTFVSFMAPPCTFGAYAHLLATKNHGIAMFFDSEHMAVVAKVWKVIFRNRIPKTLTRLERLRINTVDHLTEWLQMAFLKIKFLEEIHLRIFDRFVAHGTRTIFSWGLVILVLVGEKLKVADTRVALDMLRSPVPELRFRDVTELLSHLDIVDISEKQLMRADWKDVIGE